MSEDESFESSWSDTPSRASAVRGYQESPKPRKRGTNVHSAIAGISVHNALMQLEPPPRNAKPGSRDAPWLRLTDWEMMSLRKRMKKNAKWRPSTSMVMVELIDKGRGPYNYWEAKKQAETCGMEFLDVDNIAASTPGRPLAWGEVSLTEPTSSEDRPRNRGMALNEAKKRKRAESLSVRGRPPLKNPYREGHHARRRATVDVPKRRSSAYFQLSTSSSRNSQRSTLNGSADWESASAYDLRTASNRIPTFDRKNNPEAAQANSPSFTRSPRGLREEDSEAAKANFASFAQRLLTPFFPSSFGSARSQEREQDREALAINGPNTKKPASPAQTKALAEALSTTSKPPIIRQSFPPQLAPEPYPALQAAPHDQDPKPTSQNPQLPGAKPLFDHRSGLAKVVGRKAPVAKSPSLAFVRPPLAAKPVAKAKPSRATKPSTAYREFVETTAKSARYRKGPKAHVSTPRAKLSNATHPQPGQHPSKPTRRYIPGGPGGGGRYVDM